MTRIVNADRDVYAVEARIRRWTTLPTPVHVWGSLWDVEPVANFTDVSHIQAYVDRLVAHVGCPPVSVRERRGNTMAVYEQCTATIAVPPRNIGGHWAHNELVVLHELAHHLSRGAGHGPEFRNAFVDLLQVTNKPILARMTAFAFAEADLPID